MVDTWTSAKRSQVMALIRHKGNKSTELRLITLFQESGVIGWRRHLKMPGRPDFAFPKSRVAVFVDGDFWHGNPRTFRPPKSNVEFWMRKIEYNRKNDRHITAALKKRGWTVVRLWESDLKKSPENAILKVKRCLSGTDRIRR